MPPSTAANNAIGAVGGAVLAACLAPQLLKLYQTRSAGDLSHIFLSLYNTGLLLTFVYLYYEGATVAWICILIEIFFGLMMMAVKFYLDHYGPNSRHHRSPRRAGRAHSQPKLNNEISFAGEIRVEVRDFVTGTSAPFPLMAAVPSHRAQSLLLECWVAPRASPGADLEGSTALGSHSGEEGTSGSTLTDIARALEGALLTAGMGLKQRRQHAIFPSFREGSNRGNAAGSQPLGPRPAFSEPEEEGAEQHPDLLWLPCSDGYVTAVWHEHSACLSVDFLAASEEATRRMSAAASDFCATLQQQFPGSKMAASTVSRLPVSSQ